MLIGHDECMARGGNPHSQHPAILADLGEAETKADAPMTDWPTTVRFDALPDLIGGNINDSVAAHCILTLETVHPDEIMSGEPDAGESAPPVPACSGAEFDEHPMIEYDDDDNEIPSDLDPNYYAGLEKAMRAGAEFPPVIAARMENGSLVWIDGWHRLAVARHVGLTSILVYVVSSKDWRAAWAD